MAFCGGGFSQDACGAGDQCLHAGHPHQIGRIWTGGQGAVRLNLPGSQGSSAVWSASPLPGFIELGGSGQVRRRELEPVEPRDHALCGADLQGGWPFGYRLPPALGSSHLSL